MKAANIAAILAAITFCSTPCFAQISIKLNGITVAQIVQTFNPIEQGPWQGYNISQRGYLSSHGFAAKGRIVNRCDLLGSSLQQLGIVTPVTGLKFSRPSNVVVITSAGDVVAESNNFYWNDEKLSLCQRRGTCPIPPYTPPASLGQAAGEMVFGKNGSTFLRLDQGGWLNVLGSTNNGPAPTRCDITTG